MRQKNRNKRKKNNTVRQARYNPKERATKRRLVRKPLMYQDKTWRKPGYWILGIFLLMIVILMVLNTFRSANNFKEQLNKQDEVIRKNSKRTSASSETYFKQLPGNKVIFYQSI